MNHISTAAFNGPNEPVTVKSPKIARGASETHADEASAKSVQAKLVAKADKDGWRKREPRGGFAAKPDAFTLESLPKPKAKK